MTVRIEPMIMVHVWADRETTLAFQEWCLETRPQILSAGRHGGASGDSCCGYYSVDDEPRIREWFAQREAHPPEPCPHIAIELQGPDDERGFCRRCGAVVSTQSKSNGEP